MVVVLQEHFYTPIHYKAVYFALREMMTEYHLTFVLLRDDIHGIEVPSLWNLTFTSCVIA